MTNEIRLNVSKCSQADICSQRIYFRPFVFSLIRTKHTVSQTHLFFHAICIQYFVSVSSAFLFSLTTNNQSKWILSKLDLGSGSKWMSPPIFFHLFLLLPFSPRPFPPSKTEIDYFGPWQPAPTSLSLPPRFLCLSTAYRESPSLPSAFFVPPKLSEIRDPEEIESLSPLFTSISLASVKHILYRERARLPRDGVKITIKYNTLEGKRGEAARGRENRRWSQRCRSIYLLLDDQWRWSGKS